MRKKVFCEFIHRDYLQYYYFTAYNNKRPCGFLYPKDSCNYREYLLRNRDEE